MLALEWLAEKRIEDAVARGEFDDLPGAGRPLELDDDALVPEELRMAHRILKNANVPLPETYTRTSLVRANLEARYFGRVARKLAGRAPK
jgi:DnaJ-like protein